MKSRAFKFIAASQPRFNFYSPLSERQQHHTEAEEDEESRENSLI